jgi:hypothetical protein
MSWLQTRKARKSLQKAGMDKAYLEDVEKQLREGESAARELRDILRVIEANPKAMKTFQTITQISEGSVPDQQKLAISISLVKGSGLPQKESEALAKIIGFYYPELV